MELKSLMWYARLIADARKPPKGATLRNRGVTHQPPEGQGWELTMEAKRARAMAWIWMGMVSSTTTPKTVTLCGVKTWCGTHSLRACGSKVKRIAGQVNHVDLANQAEE